MFIVVKLKGNKCVFHCTSKPNICKGCLCLQWRERVKFCRWIKRNFQQLSLVFWEKSNALGILQQNGLNLADLQICIFLLRTISQTETSRGTNYLLSFLPYKEGNIWKTINCQEIYRSNFESKFKKCWKKNLYLAFFKKVFNTQLCFQNNLS